MDLMETEEYEMENRDFPSLPAIAAYRVTPEDEPGVRLLQRYLGRRREELVQLKDALAGSDFRLIARIGHNLHGSGAAYGLPRISALGEQIELAAERAAATSIAEIIAKLEQFLDSITIIEPA